MSSRYTPGGDSAAVAVSWSQLLSGGRYDSTHVNPELHGSMRGAGAMDVAVDRAFGKYSFYETWHPSFDAVTPGLARAWARIKRGRCPGARRGLVRDSPATASIVCDWLPSVDLP